MQSQDGASVKGWFLAFIMQNDTKPNDLQLILVRWLNSIGANFSHAYEFSFKDDLANPSTQIRGKTLKTIWGPMLEIYTIWLPICFERLGSKMPPGNSHELKLSVAVGFLADLTAYAVGAVDFPEFKFRLKALVSGNVLPHEFIFAALELLDNGRNDL